MPSQSKCCFFVHMIESPSGDDLLEDRTEHQALASALRLTGVNVECNRVVDKRTFLLAIGERLTRALKKLEVFPVFHFSLHGDQNGIAFTSGQRMSWDELREHFVDLNSRFGNAILVTFSSCFGGWGARMAMHENKPLPFHTIVGPHGSLDWADSAVAFVTFFHRLGKGATVEDAVIAMNMACGTAAFDSQRGQQVQESWAAFRQRNALQKASAAVVRSSFDQNHAPLSHRSLQGIPNRHGPLPSNVQLPSPLSVNLGNPTSPR